MEQTQDQIPAAPDSLQAWRAQKAAAAAPVEAPPVQAPPPEGPKAEPPIARDATPPAPPVLNPDLEPEPEEAPEPVVAQAESQTPRPPEQGADHRWRDPETGIRLDMRRKDHQRMKRVLEDRASMARRIEALEAHLQRPPAGPQEPMPQRTPAKAEDPEPTLEQFADQADPYGAYVAAQARWHARQEFRQQQAAHTRVERVRQTQAAIGRAQEAYDADLPKARSQYPDFDDAHQDVLDTLARLPRPARVPLVHRLLTSPIKHDLTHYLGTHPEDLAVVMQARSAHEQGIALGAIETRVRALVNQRAKPAHQSPTTPPPAPMAPVGQGSSLSATPEASKINSLAQWRAVKSKFGVSA